MKRRYAVAALAAALVAVALISAAAVLAAQEIDWNRSLKDEYPRLHEYMKARVTKAVRASVRRVERENTASRALEGLLAMMEAAFEAGWTAADGAKACRVSQVTDLGCLDPSTVRSEAERRRSEGARSLLSEDYPRYRERMKARHRDETTAGIADIDARVLVELGVEGVFESGWTAAELAVNCKSINRPDEECLLGVARELRDQQE